MEPSKLSLTWLIALLLVIVAADYYLNEKFRSWVDVRCPWIKEQLAKYDIKLKESAPETPSTAPAANALATSTPTPGIPKGVHAPTTAEPTPASIDLTTIAGAPSLWPKIVTLKKLTVFPAVMQGKEIGKINLPAGRDVKLVQIKQDKLWVAYTPDGVMANAGGAWVAANDTDLVERVQKAHPSSNP